MIFVFFNFKCIVASCGAQNRHARIFRACTPCRSIGLLKTAFEALPNVVAAVHCRRHKRGVFGRRFFVQIVKLQIFGIFSSWLESAENVESTNVESAVDSAGAFPRPSILTKPATTRRKFDNLQENSTCLIKAACNPTISTVMVCHRRLPCQGSYIPKSIIPGIPPPHPSC